MIGDPVNALDRFMRSPIGFGIFMAVELGVIIVGCIALGMSLR